MSNRSRSQSRLRIVVVSSAISSVCVCKRLLDWKSCMGERVEAPDPIAGAAAADTTRRRGSLVAEHPSLTWELVVVVAAAAAAAAACILFLCSYLCLISASLLGLFCLQPLPPPPPPGITSQGAHMSYSFDFNSQDGAVRRDDISRSSSFQSTLVLVLLVALALALAL